jgi:formate dehydrogenase major subunit
MELSRRDFIKASGAGAGAAAALSFFPNLTALAAPLGHKLKSAVKETTTICCYCSVGCGAIVTAYEDGIIKIEGDPDHPINQGALCTKGLAMSQVHQVDGKPNPYRLTKPLYRAPGAADFEEKTWDWTLNEIAKRVKNTRDKYWNAEAGRTDAIASFGGGELDNEECYILSKMNRALGLVYLEHCARI